MVSRGHCPHGTWRHTSSNPDFNSQLRIFGWEGLVIFHIIKVGSIMLCGNVLHAAMAETVASFFWRHWPEKHVLPIDDMIDHSYGCGRGLPQVFFPPTLLYII